MKILVIGSGGREHAIVRQLKESPLVEALYCAPGNGGISRDAECFPVNAMDKEGMLALAKEKQVDLVFVAPDDPLAAGMVDFIEAAGIPCFGPNAAAAQIEASKVFSKNLMKKYRIPTAGYEVFADPAAALEYIKDQGKYPAVKMCIRDRYRQPLKGRPSALMACTVGRKMVSMHCWATSSV